MSGEPSDSEDETPSILEEAAAAKRSADKAAGTKRTRQLVTGAAIGVGSAALVAALLYASRNRKNDKS
ncbi:hypothetical protein RCO27_02750 [Sphingosinicella sp. LHD-64]|uniref:hypothetical protein n=1 Tax=Sphingosinicella sp. LHD-64 TaxID=3072139 RepID=UPI00280CF29B|nr:hypothetical protein [Sphingosinicella sp. LHD-64]MDQ8755139.1 hypothetical protein [Sphingosinicella sp. LHD-64]